MKTFLLGVATLLAFGQPRITERALAEFARVSVPSALKGPDNPVPRGYASESDAAEVLAPFPLNAKVRAFVNAAHPEQAFLIGEKSNGPIVFLVLGLLLPPLGWFIGKYV